MRELSSETDIKIKLSLEDSNLDKEELEETICNLKAEILEVEGVQEISRIPIDIIPSDSKGVGGFVFDQLQGVVNPRNVIDLLRFLATRLSGNQAIEIEMEKNLTGKKLKIKINRPEDLAKVMPQIKNLLKS